MLKRILTVLGFALLSSNTLPGADSNIVSPLLLDKFAARVFKQSAGLSLNYRLFKPGHYDPHTAYPLVLFLHGAAGLGNDNQRQFRGGNEVPPLALTTEEAQAKHPCFVLAPQCPRGASWTGTGNRPAEQIEMTLAAIEALQREFNLDSNRVYLVGVSMGGGGVWDVVTRFPKMFAAAVPICGVGEPASAPKLIHQPLWCFHGAADPTVSVAHARAMIAALRKAGGQPKYTEYPGVGHDSYRNAFREPELLPWLFAQTRKP